MVHGYCIRRAGDAPPAERLTGVDGRAVRLLENRALGLWISESGSTEVSIERLRQHELVVRDALRSATPLPLRFGTLFRSEDLAIEALDEREEEFREALDRVAGRVEMGIRVSLARKRAASTPAVRLPPPAAERGTAYLQRRREEIMIEGDLRAAAAEILDQLATELRDLGVPTAANVAPQAEFVGSLAHLVHRAQVRPYRERVARLQEQRPDLRLVSSGPWAPYSFVK